VNIQFSCITFPSFFFWSFFRQARKWRLGEVAASFTLEQYTTVTNNKIKLEWKQAQRLAADMSEAAYSNILLSSPPALFFIPSQQR